MHAHCASAGTQATVSIGLRGETLTLSRAMRAARTSGRAVGTKSSLPLSALRYRLDGGSSEAVWTMNPDGLSGRALLAPAPSAITYPLALEQPTPLRATARLLPHDWRDGRGWLRASVTACDGAGNRRELWSAPLRAGGRDAPIACVVPASTTTLELSLVPGPRGDRAVARAIWTEAELLVPAPLGTASPPDTSAPSAEARPVISILVPVHDPPVHMLREMLDSVLAQTFSDWELCLADDGSRRPEVRGLLEEASASDPRIILTRLERAGGISAATNAALAVAHGTFVALLDHDDTLAPEALERMADRIAAEPDLDMLYSDEDIVLDGRRVWAHLKPGWSPDTLRTNGYTCHLGVYRRSLVREIGGFRSSFDGSQDVDMILRLVERTDRIAHVPGILYHWRAHGASTAGGEAKPYAYVAARRAISAHLERVGIDADVGFGPPGLYRVRHRLDPSVSIEVALAISGLEGVAELGDSLARQRHASWGLAMAAARPVLGEALELLGDVGVPASRIRTHEVPRAATRMEALAEVTRSSRADHLLLLRGPARAITVDWLSRLLGYSAQPGIAAAGGVVVSADGRVLDAGVAMPEGMPLALLYGTRTSMDHFFGYGTSVYNVLAVGDACATSRAALATTGLRPELQDLAIVDYCLRCEGRVVIVPDVRLRALGEDPIVNDIPTLRTLWSVWHGMYRGDPYYNPGYRTDRGDFELAA